MTDGKQTVSPGPRPRPGAWIHRAGGPEPWGSMTLWGENIPAYRPYLLRRLSLWGEMSMSKRPWGALAAVFAVNILLILLLQWAL